MNNKIYYFLILFTALFGFMNADIENQGIEKQGVEKPSDKQNQTIGFMDFYHIPGSKAIVRFDYFTLHSVKEIQSGKQPWWHMSPAPNNKIFLDDGSAWEIESSASGIYGDYIMRVGDPIILHLSSDGKKFILEAPTTNKNVKAAPLKSGFFPKDHHQYEISDIITSDNDNIVILKDAESDMESVWKVADSRELKTWSQGDYVIIGSTTGTLLEIPKHLLINGTLLKRGVDGSYVEADLSG